MTRDSRNVTVIGDGGWGTALATVLDENRHRVTVWCAFDEHVDRFRKRGENDLFLPGVPLPDRIGWTSDRAEAVRDADHLVMAVPTRFFASVAKSFHGLPKAGVPVVSVAKGLDPDTGERMTQVLQRSLKPQAVAVLSGPSHAEEVARSIPTAVTVAAEDPAVAETFQTLFNNDHFRVYTSSDVIGTELGGAAKNVIAIAVGISDGLGFGDNTRAALITRGLVEISRLGCALGADPDTFAGLSGLGDLVVTCTSRHSRNRGVGERLGRGETIDSIVGGMQQVAEGVGNALSIRNLAQRQDVEVPIIEEVCAVVHDGKPPMEAVTSLMSRDVKPE